jgi:hypothetical protein
MCRPAPKVRKPSAPKSNLKENYHVDSRATKSQQRKRATFNRSPHRGRQTACLPQRTQTRPLRQGSLIPGEDPDDYNQHCAEALFDFRPVTSAEENLVDQIADITWRLKRFSRIEAAVIQEFYNNTAEQPLNQGQSGDLIGKALADTNRLAAINILGRYDGQLSRRYHRAIKELRDMQQQRTRGLNLGGLAALLQPKQPTESPAAESTAAADPTTDTGRKTKTTEPTQSIATLLESVAPINSPPSSPPPEPDPAAPTVPAITNPHRIPPQNPAGIDNLEATK